MEEEVDVFFCFFCFPLSWGHETLLSILPQQFIIIIITDHLLINLWFTAILLYYYLYKLTRALVWEGVVRIMPNRTTNKANQVTGYQISGTLNYIIDARQ